MLVALSLILLSLWCCVQEILQDLAWHLVKWCTIRPVILVMWYLYFQNPGLGQWLGVDFTFRKDDTNNNMNPHRIYQNEVTHRCGILHIDFTWWRGTFDGKCPLLEDNFWRKMTCDGTKPLMEEDLWWKSTFDGGCPLIKDNNQWKTIFDGRWPLMEDALWWKTTFDERRPLMEDDPKWKMT